jgi:vancomycin aglycone glucosyltransferase
MHIIGQRIIDWIGHTSAKPLFQASSSPWELLMKFVLTGYGSRGDVEPCVALGIELQHRGHHVRLAVPPAAVRRVNALGLSASAYGADLSALRPLLQDASFILGIADKMNDSHAVLHEVMEFVMPIWTAKTAQLIELANDADLLVAGITEQEIAANVAESCRISVAALHLFPAHVLAQSQFRRQVLSLANAAQRRALGLPEASKVRTTPLEIQAYDLCCFPELAVGWTQPNRRPFVGALRLASSRSTDSETLAWMADGTPPIYFGFGSTPIGSLASLVAIIGVACAEIGERALICTGEDTVTRVSHASHVKIVGAVDHAEIFPKCRAVVHHGGAGTTAAGLRAGVPTLILWFAHDQPAWAAAVERLKVGAGRPFAATDTSSLVADLRRVLTAGYFARAREVGDQMVTPAQSVSSAANLLESSGMFARHR